MSVPSAIGSSVSFRRCAAAARLCGGNFAGATYLMFSCWLVLSCTASLASGDIAGSLVEAEDGCWRSSVCMLTSFYLQAPAPPPPHSYKNLQLVNTFNSLLQRFLAALVCF